MNKKNSARLWWSIVLVLLVMTITSFITTPAPLSSTNDCNKCDFNCLNTKCLTNTEFIKAVETKPSPVGYRYGWLASLLIYLFISAVLIVN